MNKMLRSVAAALLVYSMPLYAQSPGEIAFWESVRDSRNASELRAYLQQYPNGTYKVLAEARLAALQKPTATPPRAPTASAERSVIAASAPANAQPGVGDLWTYRLSYPRLRGQWGQRERPAAMYTIRASAVSGSEITDQLAIDGGSPSDFRHRKGGYLADEGVSVFSPYLTVFEALTSGSLVDPVEVLDAACLKTYRCEAKARNGGKEIVEVAAGRFEAFKIIVEQQWSPFNVVSTAGSAGADMTGGRTLTAWYSPQVKRVVKYSSRLVAGAIPPMDANFDLELVSYQLKSAQPANPAAAAPQAPAAAADRRVVAAAAPSNARPTTGDVWNYRLTYPRLRGQWGQTERPAAIYIVTAGAVSAFEITDQLSIDGGSPSDFKHGTGTYLAAEGVSVLSPYLAVFQGIASGARVGPVEVRDTACGSGYRCDAKARSAGKEIVDVPAGRFEAFKIIVEQQWSPFSVVSTLGSAGADMTGGRTLTAWYSPQVKRVVKYSSRLVAGAIPPMDANFDLELVSYQLK